MCEDVHDESGNEEGNIHENDENGERMRLLDLQTKLFSFFSKDVLQSWFARIERTLHAFSVIIYFGDSDVKVSLPYGFAWMWLQTICAESYLHIVEYNSD